MRIGLCAKLDFWDLAEELGYDYLEFPANQLGTMDDEEYARLCALQTSHRMKIERCNLLYPKAMTLIGSGKSGDDAVLSYAERLFARMQTLGIPLVVFGSGKSRMCPEGEDRGKAFDELVAITCAVADIAKGHHITLAIEALNKAETNMINTLMEGRAFARAVDKDNVSMLVDMFHIVKDDGDMDDILALDKIVHAHIAIRGTRGYPVVEDTDICAFFAALHAKGYDSTLSIEGKTDNMAKDAKDALALLRRMSK